MHATMCTSRVELLACRAVSAGQSCARQKEKSANSNELGKTLASRNIEVNLRGFDHSTSHDQLSYPDVLVVKAQKTVYSVHVRNLNLTT